MVGELLGEADLDVAVKLPEGFKRVARLGLVNLAPWHLMTRDLGKKRIIGLRQRYSRQYVPLARRQDNDDLACIDPNEPGKIVIVHDFAAEGHEQRQIYADFWTWFRAAIEEMIEFE